MDQELMEATRLHVKGMSRFDYFQAGELHYITVDSGFPFVVSVADTHTARFGVEEKSLTMMKFIRSQLMRNLIGQAESQKQ